MKNKIENPHVFIKRIIDGLHWILSIYVDFDKVKLEGDYPEIIYADKMSMLNKIDEANDEEWKKEKRNLEIELPKIIWESFDHLSKVSEEPNYIQYTLGVLINCVISVMPMHIVAFLGYTRAMLKKPLIKNEPGN